MSLALCIARTPEEWLQILVIRGIVFCEGQGIPYTVERDAYDMSALHILGRVGDEPVAAGRIRILDKMAKLERIAVRPKWRGRGFGKALTRFMIATANELDCIACRLHAQVHLEQFYGTFGFVTEGGVFQEAGIDHIAMMLRL